MRQWRYAGSLFMAPRTSQNSMIGPLICPGAHCSRRDGLRFQLVLTSWSHMVHRWVVVMWVISTATQSILVAWTCSAKCKPASSPATTYLVTCTKGMVPHLMVGQSL